MLPRVMATLMGLLCLFPASGLAVIHDISITGFDFSPGNQTIDQGDTVRWTNLDPVGHSSTSDAGVWDSGTLSNGQSYQRVFDSPGIFAYHCTPHPSMKDTLTVTATPVFDLQIEIGDNFFNPLVALIDVGQTVRWHNGGGMDHTSTEGNGLWDSGAIAVGGTFDFTFSNEGVYDYVCSFHEGMAGTVIVGRPDSVAVDIDIVDFAFDPIDIEVIIGQNVRWINFGGRPHTSTESGGAWDSGNLEPGDVFTLQADTAGIFNYICSFHPDMMGSLTVTDTSGGGGCVYVPGDINGNGTTNGIDVGYGVNYFKGGPIPPIQCDMCPQTPPFYAAGDVNGNCVFNGIDVSFFVNYLKGITPALLYCASCPPSVSLAGYRK